MKSVLGQPTLKDINQNHHHTNLELKKKSDLHFPTEASLLHTFDRQRKSSLDKIEKQQGRR